MKKKILLLVLLVSLFTSPVYAAMVATITLVESSSTTYAMLGATVSMDNEYLASEGYTLTTGLDVDISNLPFMLADDRTLIATPLPADSSRVLSYTTGNTPDSAYYVIPGYEGYVTAPDDATLELGASDWSLEWKGYVDTATTGNIVSKSGSYELTVPSAGNVRIATRSSGSTSDLDLIPIGAGDYTNISSQEPVTGDHYDKVDDPVGTPDDAATYVYQGGNTEMKDAYVIPNHTTESGWINSVTVYVRAYQSGGGSGLVKPYLRLGTDENEDGWLSYGAAWSTQNKTLDRPGGGIWSWSDIDNLQVGIGAKVSAGGNVQVTQVYVKVNYNPGSFVQTSLISGEHTVTASRTGAVLDLTVDAVSQGTDTATNVVDNANVLVSCEDDTVIYTEYVKLDVAIEYIFNAASSWYTYSTALDSTHFVVVFTDAGDSNYGKAMVGTVTGDTIAYGTEYTFNAASTRHISCAALDSTHFVVIFRDEGDSDYGKAMIGTVTGDTIAYGAEYTFNAASTWYSSCAALDSTHFVVVFEDYGDASRGKAMIGTVTGDTIAYGAEYTFNAATTYFASCAALDSTHFVVVFEDYGDASYGKAMVGTVTGNAIAYGTEYTFNAATTRYTSCTALDSMHFVVIFRDEGDASRGKAMVGTVTGDTIAYGAEYTFNAASTWYSSCAALDSTHFVVVFRDGGDASYGKAMVGTVTGNAIAYGTEYTFNAANSWYTHCASLDSTHFVVVFEDYGDSEYGIAVIGTVTGDTIAYISVEKLWYQPNAIVAVTYQDDVVDSGTTVTLVDAALTQVEDYWNLARLIITDTTDDLAPKGENAVVTDFVAGTDTLHFAALTAGVEAGDTYTVEFGTLVDRVGTNNGTITWGVNPSGVATSIGALLPPVVVLPSSGVTDVPDLTPSVGQSAVDGIEGSNLPFYGMFKSLMTDYHTVGGPNISMPYFWQILAAIIAFIIGTTALIASRNLLVGVGAYTLCISVPTAMGILSWYWLIWYVLGAVAVSMLTTKWFGSSM